MEDEKDQYTKEEAEADEKKFNDRVEHYKGKAKEGAKKVIRGGVAGLFAAGRAAKAGLSNTNTYLEKRAERQAVYERSHPQELKTKRDSDYLQKRAIDPYSTNPLQQNKGERFGGFSQPSQNTFRPSGLGWAGPTMGGMARPAPTKKQLTRRRRYASRRAPSRRPRVKTRIVYVQVSPRRRTRRY